MTVIVRIHDTLASYPNIKSLQNDFRSYKEGKCQPSYFGRDADYTTPLICKQEEVMHLHLCPSDVVWRHPVAYNRTSDKHLVYCRGYLDKNHYLLITVLDPNAHEEARNNNRMNFIGRIAEKFRQEI